MFVTANVDYRVWRKYAKPILIICFIMLIAVLIPGIGVVRGGARSWLGIGSFGIQPSEFMKLGMILFLAHWLSKDQVKLRPLQRGCCLPWTDGASLWHNYVAARFGYRHRDDGRVHAYHFHNRSTNETSCSACTWWSCRLRGTCRSGAYRLQRITAFLDPWSDPLGAGYQIIQSLYAIGPGGLAGLELG